MTPDPDVSVLMLSWNTEALTLACLGALEADETRYGREILVLDNASDDTYRATSSLNSGMGNVSGECMMSRPNAVSIGVMIDAGGNDTYDYPAAAPVQPTNSSTFGFSRFGLPSEHGAGLDTEGETGVHAYGASAQ